MMQGFSLVARSMILETRKWTEIPNMSPGRNGIAGEAEMPAPSGCSSK